MARSVKQQKNLFYEITIFLVSKNLRGFPENHPEVSIFCTNTGKKQGQKGQIFACFSNWKHLENQCPRVLLLQFHWCRQSKN